MGPCAAQEQKFRKSLKETKLTGGAERIGSDQFIQSQVRMEGKYPLAIMIEHERTNIATTCSIFEWGEPHQDLWILPFLSGSQT